MSTTAAPPDPAQPIDPLAAPRAPADPEHDVYLTGLAGWPPADRLAFANLTAALSVQRFGGSPAAPGWAEAAAWWNRTERSAGGGADAAALARRHHFPTGLIPATVRDWPRPRALPTIGFRGE